MRVTNRHLSLAAVATAAALALTACGGVENTAGGGNDRYRELHNRGTDCSEAAEGCEPGDIAETRCEGSRHYRE